MSTSLLVGWVELDRALGPSLGCTKQTALWISQLRGEYLNVFIHPGG